ncbi:MAG TPA: DUF4058 family protein [Armatimonadetes bacterium]|nr:DUF4058 family protein [Armatimonadota bacterium]
MDPYLEDQTLWPEVHQRCFRQAAELKPTYLLLC